LIFELLNSCCAQRWDNFYMPFFSASRRTREFKTLNKPPTRKMNRGKELFPALLEEGELDEDQVYIQCFHFLILVSRIVGRCCDSLLRSWDVSRIELLLFPTTAGCLHAPPWQQFLAFKQQILCTGSLYSPEPTSRGSMLTNHSPGLSPMASLLC